MSNRRKLPLISFGAVEDFTTWSKAGTPVVTGGQNDPFGGTNAYLVDDNDAAGLEYIFISNITLTPSAEGEAISYLFLKAGTAAKTELLLRDQDTPAARHQINVTWSAGVPTLSTASGAGTLFPPISCGDGWYFIRFSATGIVTGNRHQPHIFPAGDTPTDTGTVLVYGRSVILFGHPLDDVNAWDDPREGTTHVRSPDGSEDARTAGDDHLLGGAARWIPNLDTPTPYNATGWDGRREHALVNVGWASFLRFGYTSDPFTFTPDQSVAAINTSVILAEPRDPGSLEPSLEDADVTKAVSLVLRDVADVPFKGY